MQEKLVIYLHAHDLSRPAWAVLNADHSIRESALQDNPEGFAHIAEGKQVIVIVPSEDVLITTIQLPKMNRTRLMQALPYALEEQLIDDVDALHFAPGEYQNGELPVAIVAHTKMQEWLALLQSWGLKPDVLLPLVLALPLAEHNWHILIQNLAIARTGLFNTFTCDVPNLAQMLDSALSQRNVLPTLIHIHNTTQQAVAGTLDIEVQVKEDFITPMQALALVAHHAIGEPALNLLQGQYAVKKSRLPQMNLLWKVTTALAVGWVFLLFYGPIMSYFVLHHKVSEINTQIAQIYKKQFPQATSMVAPKLRMEEKLHKLNAQVGENRLLLLLGYVGKAMQATEGVKLKRMDFQGNLLTLDLSATTSEDFAAFTDFLTQNGLAVKQQNANLTGTRVNATVQVE